MGEFGIKETQELLDALNKVAIVFIGLFKDGVQFGDFVDFYNQYKDNPELKDALAAAYDNYKAIPDEVSDIDVSEATQLFILQASYIPKLLEALKSESA